MFNYEEEYYEDSYTTSVLDATIDGIHLDENGHYMYVDDEGMLANMNYFFRYTNGKDFDKERIWKFVQADQGWMPTKYNYDSKLSRYLNLMVKWGFIIKEKRNHYTFNHIELRQFEHEND